MTRKTFEVSKMVDMANQMLASGVQSQESRWGTITMIEQILHSSGNYNGFRYLGATEVPNGELPGVRYGDDGMILEYPERFENTDDTRRQYG